MASARRPVCSPAPHPLLTPPLGSSPCWGRTRGAGGRAAGRGVLTGGGWARRGPFPAWAVGGAGHRRRRWDSLLGSPCGQTRGQRGALAPSKHPTSPRCRRSSHPARSRCGRGGFWEQVPGGGVSRGPTGSHHALWSFLKVLLHSGDGWASAEGSRRSGCLGSGFLKVRVLRGEGSRRSGRFGGKVPEGQDALGGGVPEGQGAYGERFQRAGSLWVEGEEWNV